MSLTKLLIETYDFKKVNDVFNLKTYRFKTSSDLEYDVYFALHKIKSKVFYIVSFDHNKNQEVVEVKDALTVIRTVVEIIEDMVDNEDVDGFLIEPKNDKLANIYKKIIEKSDKVDNVEIRKTNWMIVTLK